MKRSIELECSTCVGRANGVFCELGMALLVELDEHKNANTYKKGQNLFLEGNIPFGLYCVHSGKVKITKLGSDGKETIVRLASEGDILGHRSLFSSSRYTATATVVDEAIVCFISKELIQKLVQKEPRLALQIINRLSKQMGAAEELLANMAQKSVRERFASLLLLLKESYGAEEAGKVRLDIKLTREEMASMVGAATENLIRLVTEFKNDGYIEQVGKSIYILDIRALEKISAISL